LDNLRIEIIIKTKTIKPLYDFPRIAYYFATAYFPLLFACTFTAPAVTVAIKQTVSRIVNTFFIFFIVTFLSYKNFLVVILSY